MRAAVPASRALACRKKMIWAPGRGPHHSIFPIFNIHKKVVIFAVQELPVGRAEVPVLSGSDRAVGRHLISRPSKHFVLRANERSEPSMEKIMSRVITIGLSMLAGAALGAAAVGSLHAQSKPGAYAVVDISDITNEADYRTLLPKTGPAMAPFGGQYVIRTENIVGIDGAPPKRFVVIAFDTMEKAKAWDASAPQKEITTIRLRSTKSRQFLVDGAIQ
jgi:uncharacterized protein (DUF1330 family)